MVCASSRRQTCPASFKHSSPQQAARVGWQRQSSLVAVCCLPCLAKPLAVAVQRLRLPFDVANSRQTRARACPHIRPKGGHKEWEGYKALKSNFASALVLTPHLDKDQKPKLLARPWRNSSQHVYRRKAREWHATRVHDAMHAFISSILVTCWYLVRNGCLSSYSRLPRCVRNCGNYLLVPVHLPTNTKIAEIRA